MKTNDPLLFAVDRARDILKAVRDKDKDEERAENLEIIIKKLDIFLKVYGS